MKLSVIVPVYNVENYIEACVQSLLSQSYEDFEIIIVDDGSRDSSIERARKMVVNRSDVKILSKKNGGLSDARNFGIEHSTGEYLAFIDSDDTIHPDMFKSMMSKLISEQADVCSCDMEYVYSDGRRVRSSGSIVSEGNHFSIILTNNSACNKLFKRSLFDQIRFPIGKWYEDLATIPILLKRASKAVHVDQVFYYYFQREGSIAHGRNDKMFDIYWAIQNIEVGLDCAKNPDWIEVKQRLLIEHGLFLTNLRIKKMDLWNDRRIYFRKNVQFLKSYYSNWYRDGSLSSYSHKARIIFKLLELHCFGLVAFIYKG